MRVYVTNHSDDSERTFQGTPEQVDLDLQQAYPWLQNNGQIGDEVMATIEHLDSTQMYQVHVEGELEDSAKPEEDEVHKFLSHPDPVERRMALRFDTVKPAHVLRAVLDPEPSVHEAAMDHPHFGDVEAMHLMSAKSGADGLYPALQQSAFLRRTDRVRPEHVTAVLRNAREFSPEANEAIRALLVAHPALSHDNIRDLFHSPATTDDQRLQLLRPDLDVPEDVLSHVVRGAAAFPSEGTKRLGLAAMTHPLFNPSERDSFVVPLDATSNPELVDLASQVMRASTVSPPVADHLFIQALLKPSDTTAGMLSAFLSGPGATSADVDRALASGNAGLLRGAAGSSAIQPQQFDQIVARANAVGDQQLLQDLQSHKMFSDRHLAAFVSPGEPVAKAEGPDDPGEPREMDPIDAEAWVSRVRHAWHQAPWGDAEPKWGHLHGSLVAGSPEGFEYVRSNIHPVAVAGRINARAVKLRERRQLATRYVAKSERDQLTDLAAHPVVESCFGFDPLRTPQFRAAKFLAGGKEISQGEAKSAVYEDDGDREAAALRAYGLEVSDENRSALRAVQDVGDLGKAVPPTPNAQDVSAPHPEGKDVAAAITRAYGDQFVVPVQLGGKHSKGSMLAHDSVTGVTWLLKSGSGGAGVAAGASEDPSNPNAREAAWFHIAKAWGVVGAYPRAELVFIDGHPYAALALLPWAYKPLEKMRQKDPGAPPRVLAPYLADGRLHEWAVMDYVFGNPDSHGENVMVDDEQENHERRRHYEYPDDDSFHDDVPDVKLIDHGSAFAGDEFDPAHDRSSFVPFYLRGWAPHVNFNQLPVAEKLKHMPRVHPDVARRLGSWLDGVSEETAKTICQRYGIDPAPQLQRLARLRALAKTMPVDEAVNRLWATT